VILKRGQIGKIGSDSWFPARYWEKPNEFIPERFLGDYDKDAFLAFSVG